ncbi:hypothetical protein BGZ72_000523, partial [Mortierella alpina]
MHSFDSRTPLVVDDFDCEESFYDHYDIQLERKQAHQYKTSKLRRRSETKVLLPILKTSRKNYVIPLELLGLVCTHLSQATLRFAVSLVCKEWYTVSKLYIRRTGVWKYPTEEQERQLLAHMPILSTLECWYGSPSAYLSPGPVLTRSPGISWDRFRTAISAPLSFADKDQMIDSTSPTCLLHHIRRLILKGPEIAWGISIFPILGPFQFLQSLELRMGSIRIPLFELLNNSPCLTELKVMCHIYHGTQLLSGDDEDQILETPDSVIDPATAHFPRKPPVIIPPKAYPDRYKLQVFDIDHVVVKQRVLERVIATCPDLRVFKLHDINKPFWIPELSMSKHYPIDEERLWNHLKDYCPKINWYHILTVRSMHVNGLKTLERILQNRALGRFLTTSFTSKWHDLLEDLDVRRALRRVTVLEVLPVNGYPCETQYLQQLLCLMPNLLHVIAPNVVFGAADLLVMPGGAHPESPRKEFIQNNRFRKRQE